MWDLEIEGTTLHVFVTITCISKFSQESWGGGQGACVSTTFA